MKNINHPSDTLPNDYIGQTGLPLCSGDVLFMTKNATKKRHRGAHFVESRNMWMSCIGYKRKQIFLGYFKIEEDAARAYDKAVLYYFPNSNKRLNFPTDAEPPITIPNTRWVRLTQGKFALVDEENYELLNKYNWCANKHCNTYYARKSPNEFSRAINDKKIMMHQIVLCVYDGTFIDHINHDGLDNRKCNLRKCTHSENMANIKSIAESSSIYKGVCWYKKKEKWCGYIRVNKKLIHLGYFETQELAAEEYNKAALLYFKDRASLNIIIYK